MSEPEWTLATLKEHLEARIDNLDRLTDAKFITFRTLMDAESERVVLALNSADKAVTKAETATEKRFESVNEFRATLSEQSATFLTRNEYDSAHTHLSQQVIALQDRLNLAEGRSRGASAIWVYALGAIATFTTVASLFLAFAR
jgi:hypothetical protein